MINEKSIQTVERARFGPHFVAPQYESYCFANIPGTVNQLLGLQNDRTLPSDVLGNLPQQYNKVLVFYIDAFGWEMFTRALEKSPFLQRFATEGAVSKLTSQFPSTTAAHMTTIVTGQPVGESGVYEWFYYEPLLDEVIMPMLFSYAGPKIPNTLAPTGLDPSLLYPQRTIHQDLQEHGIKSYVFQYAPYVGTPYSNFANAGTTELVPFRTVTEASTLLAKYVGEVTDKSYFFFYYDTVDAIGHDYGPASRQYAAELDTCLYALEQVFHQNVVGKTDATLLLVITDHGQVRIDPATTIYLNHELPEITPFIETNKQGKLITPAGSNRAYFLHVAEENHSQAIALLENKLRGKAEIRKVRELIAAGFFGKTISETFLARVGDLVILPYPGESVWWYEKDRFENQYYGHHGGLTIAEMEIPFLALPL